MNNGIRLLIVDEAVHVRVRERLQELLHGESVILLEGTTSSDKNMGLIGEGVVKQIVTRMIDDGLATLREQDARRRRLPGLDTTGKGGKRKNKWARWHG